MIVIFKKKKKESEFKERNKKTKKIKKGMKNWEAIETHAATTRDHLTAHAATTRPISQTQTKTQTQTATTQQDPSAFRRRFHDLPRPASLLQPSQFTLHTLKYLIYLSKPNIVFVNLRICACGVCGLNIWICACGVFLVFWLCETIFFCELWVLWLSVFVILSLILYKEDHKRESRVCRN